MDEYFVGHKAYKIDAKGRISIPANMRASLGQEFIASRGMGKCLALYPMEEWNEFMNKIRTTVNQKKRKQLEFYFSANAEKMSLDGQGRLLLNESLRRQVDLYGEKEAEIFGNNKRIEIWNCDLFNEQLNSINEEEVVDILDEYGI
ncbi:MAG: division/cell wall cluster transcriptional repressor MraZ [Eubacterium sp.]